MRVISVPTATSRSRTTFIRSASPGSSASITRCIHAASDLEMIGNVGEMGRGVPLAALSNAERTISVSFLVNSAALRSRFIRSAFFCRNALTMSRSSRRKRTSSSFANLLRSVFAQTNGNTSCAARSNSSFRARHSALRAPRCSCAAATSSCCKIPIRRTEVRARSRAARRPRVWDRAARKASLAFSAAVRAA